MPMELSQKTEEQMQHLMPDGTECGFEIIGHMEIKDQFEQVTAIKIAFRVYDKIGNQFVTSKIFTPDEKKMWIIKNFCYSIKLSHFYDELPRRFPEKIDCFGKFGKCSVSILAGNEEYPQSKNVIKNFLWEKPDSKKQQSKNVYEEMEIGNKTPKPQPPETTTFTDDDLNL